MHKNKAWLLLQQSEQFQDLKLSTERAEELAPIVESFVDAVAENAPLLPYDSDATAFHAALHAFKDDWSPE